VTPTPDKHAPVSRVSSEARHYLLVLVVFGITGSIAVFLSKLVLSNLLGLDGSLWAGPWSFRVAYLLLIPPSYSVTLVAVGTLFGKREYFTRRVMRIWGRPLRMIGLGPKPDRSEQHLDQ
jgi:hypothetical protein